MCVVGTILVAATKCGIELEGDVSDPPNEEQVVVDVDANAET